MKIQFLGHAGFLVNAKSLNILIDPWFHSAFFGSWFPYPDNRHLEAEVLDQKIDYLYISHTHEDHLDWKFLRRFNHNIPILCPDYRSKALAKKLRSLGFKNIIDMGHRQPFHLPHGLQATVFLDVSHKEDSGLMIEEDGVKFLDLNDCNTKLSELPTDVTLLAAQFSGAMWYPNRYDYPPDVMQEKTDAIRSDLLKTLVNKINVIKPKYYMPCAGPACFLDPELQQFNDRKTTIFPDWNTTKDKFVQVCPNQNIIQVKCGDKIDLSMEQVEPHPTIPCDDIQAYSAARKDEWNITHECNVDTEELKSYFEKLSKRNRHILEEAITFRIKTENKSWAITVHKESVQIKESNEEISGYEFTLPNHVLVGIIINDGGWEEALLSMRIKLKRNPDVYDTKLFGLLRYGTEPAQTRQMVNDGKNKETITRNGVTLPRYCPHAGEDLSFAQIENNILTCPRHHWQWDLKTGECIKGGNIKLKCEECINKT